MMQSLHDAVLARGREVVSIYAPWSLRLHLHLHLHLDQQQQRDTGLLYTSVVLKTKTRKGQEAIALCAQTLRRTGRVWSGPRRASTAVCWRWMARPMTTIRNVLGPPFPPPHHHHHHRRHCRHQYQHASARPPRPAGGHRGQRRQLRSRGCTRQRDAEALQ